MVSVSSVASGMEVLVESFSSVVVELLSSNEPPLEILGDSFSSLTDKQRNIDQY